MIESNHSDLHIHTNKSACARAEMNIPDIIRTAKSRGCSCIGLTDHIYYPSDVEKLRLSRNEINLIDSTVKVLLGCEFDILDIGRHTLTDEMMPYLDFVMAAANHLHSSSVAQPEDMSLRGIGLHYLKLFKYACTLDFVDVVAHPMFVYPGTFDPASLDLLKDDEIMQAIELAKENNIAMEISPRALAPNQLEFRIRFYTLCKNAGLKFSLGTDSHRLKTVGKIDVLEPLIEKLEIEDFLSYSQIMDLKS